MVSGKFFKIMVSGKNLVEKNYSETKNYYYFKMSNNDIENLSFDELLKQMPKELKERFNEINKLLISNDVYFNL